MRRRAVPVSKLADYASDPVDYCKRRGGPRSAKAVRCGTARHNDLVGRVGLVWRLVPFALLLLGGYLLGLYLGVFS